MGHQFKPEDSLWTNAVGYHFHNNIHLSHNDHHQANEVQHHHGIHYNASLHDSSDYDTVTGMASSQNLISDMDLVSLPMEKLKVILRRLSKYDAQRLKKLRRRLQNRIYARECRDRRLQKILDLRNQVRALQEELQHVIAERDRLLHEHQRYQQLCLELGLSDTAYQLPISIN